MELARSIVSRLRQYVGDRRHSTRLKGRLTFSLSLISSTKQLDGRRRTTSMVGHTWDLSESGLALIVPAITLNDHHLVGENRSLNLQLELPERVVVMQVTPVRYERLEEQTGETGYLIAVKITGITKEDRAAFSEYVATLP